MNPEDLPAQQPPPDAESPLAFLRAAARSAPSAEILSQLAESNVTDGVKVNADLSAPYLAAVARHLTTEVAVGTARTRTFREAEASQTIGKIFAVSFISRGDTQLGFRGGKSQVERTHIEAAGHGARIIGLTTSIFSVLLFQTVGSAVTNCQPRALICQTGILPVMANALQPNLTPLHVEFLQACIFAEQYSYAERWISDSWPRPSDKSATVLHVLRYFFLRGSIHMACENYTAAIRCFWTCLSIPSDIPSNVAIAAWKKLVLVRCLVSEDCNLETKSESPAFALPKAAPTAVSRLVSLAVSVPRAKQTSVQDQPELEVHMVEAGGPPHEGEAAAENPPQKGPSDLMKAYVFLVRAYFAVDRKAFREILQEHQQIFQEDGNLGWVYQCQTSLIRRHIYHISSIYASIPLTRLSELLELPDDQVQRFLLQLSIDRAWNIEYRQDSNNLFVIFPPRTQESVVESKQVLQLAYLMRSLDVSVASSSKFASLARKDGGSKKTREKSPSRSVSRNTDNMV